MRYLSLLRGINVSGQKKIKMADLQNLYEGIDMEDVTTYIQSGNVIFESKEKPAIIKEKIIKAILEKYGYDVHIFLYNLKEWKAIISQCPYPITNDNIDKIYVSFLSSHPDSELYTKMEQENKSKDQMTVVDKAIYTQYATRYSDSKIHNNFYESKLKTTATTRNWKTVIKLEALMES